MPRDTAPIFKALELYDDHHLTLAVIGKRFGVSDTTVRRWIARARKLIASQSVPA